MNASMLVRLLFAALCAAPARAICREPHPLLPTYWSADEPKLAVVGIYFKDLPASHVPTPAEFAAMVHGPAVVAALDRMSDGCLNATTFAPDFYVVKNEGATHPLEEGGRVSCGQADDFFETSSVRNLGFDFDDYDGVLFSPIGHCSADGSGAGWYKYVGSVDGRTVYNVQGIFMSTDLRPWCALGDAACDFAAAAPYTRDRTYVHELIHWFGFAAHSSMTDCADPDADGLDPLLCPTIGYGDPFSVMGPSGGVANLPAYIKYHLGWLGADDVEVVRTRGEFQLAAVDAPRGGAAKRFAYLPESDLYVHWRNATELPDPAGPEPEDDYAGFFVHRWSTLVDAHVTSCAAGDDEAARAERAAHVTLKPGSTFKARTQGVVLRAGAAGGATRGLECGNTGNYCGEGGEAFRPFRSNFDGSDRVPDFPGGVTLHSVEVKNADLGGCGDRAAPFDLAVARTELPEGYGFDPQKYHMELRPRGFSGNARSMAFAFGLPANMSDYDSCLTATNHDTGLRAAQIHRITLPYDGREVWYRNNRPADYAGVDPDLAAYCASLNGCGRAGGDCPAAGAGGGHCDLDKACDGADAPAMNGLVAYGSSDSDDSDGEASRNDAGAADAFGESDAESDAAEPDAAPVAAPSGLPSADSVLSDDVAAGSWLQKPAWATAPKAPRPAKPAATAPSRLAPGAKAEGDEGDEKGDDMYATYDPAKGWSGKQKSNIADNGLSGYKGHGGGRRPAAPAAAPPPAAARAAPPRGGPQAGGRKRDKPDRVNAKERVKQQRLNGQSGIGENFKVWRSEEEMRLRQHYD
ncbi:hypothetical protein AURANDRAFT_65623 [Aureococcus anophagefferens]|uniref:Peptidase M43 pregnancy-associated plasma-A domain-containing protein n=1 Tax=Aureococcus anophagefferens TaxID=44056 RepID=F0YEK2_AURAN|nr:hypothetical protein AURANDRAFT_65623 [Aureococcus anophagefferens]EGB06461.1 hypothetical protein AURANDRAFT_65623 [Aureococcus anophagefferens]|eukprot:XP_009039031.1 hypothetical protein AURANDRAFT_65623 [Aureococcus anophagefferens]